MSMAGTPLTSADLILVDSMSPLGGNLIIEVSLTTCAPYDSRILSTDDVGFLTSEGVF